MELTGKQKAYLRGLAHDLHPVVLIGKEGPSEAVVRKAHLELMAHQLIKVRIAEGAEADIKTLAVDLATRTQSAVAQRIGHVLVLYRRRTKSPTIILPK